MGPVAVSPARPARAARFRPQVPAARIRPESLRDSRPRRAMARGYAQQPTQPQGPGFGDRAAEAAQTFRRHVRTPETKPFFQTSEFAVWALTVIGLLIAGAAVTAGPTGDVLRANTVWTLITVISFAYIISRGISKAGTKYRDRDGGPGGY